MLSLHTKGFHSQAGAAVQPNDGLNVNDKVVWIDLVNPTRDEELRSEAQLGVLLPTREDMDEIETSSRLYIEDSAVFMTAQIAFFGGQERLQSGPVTFVLVGHRLVTIRYVDPASFAIFAEHIEKQPILCVDGATTFLNLLDVIIDRTADLLEKTGNGIDELSKSIFTTKRKTKLEDVLISLGGAQNDIAKIRDSLVSLSRLVAFATADATTAIIGTPAVQEFHDRLRTMGQDVMSLSDHSTYITGNIAFLLDAALGLISVEQNTVMKVMSVTAAIFLPLTLIASIYGMNFVDMPFLHNADAFWAVCGLMLCIAGGLIWWFKTRRWL